MTVGAFAGIQHVDKKEMYLASAIFVFGTIALIYLLPMVIYPFTFALGAFKKWLFSLRLNRLAKKHGYKVTKLASPFVSMFKSYPGTDLVLEKNGETIRIKYLPFHTARKVVHISGDTVYIARKSALTKNWGYWKKRYDVVSSKAVEIPIEKRSLKHKLNLGFGEYGKDKCVIAYPASVVFMRYAHKTGWVVVDNGVEYYGGAKFYDYKLIIKKIKEELF